MKPSSYDGLPMVYENVDSVGGDYTISYIIREVGVG